MIFLLLLLFASSLYSMSDKITLSPASNIVIFKGEQYNLEPITKRSISTFTRPVISCVFYKTFYMENQLYKKQYTMSGIQQRTLLKNRFKPKSKRPITFRIHEIEATTSLFE